MKFGYTGNCHCGRNRVHLVTSQAISTRICFSCGCDVCKKNGVIWTRADGSDTIVKGTRGMNEEHGDIVSYSTPSIIYKFCTTCGTGIIGQHVSDIAPSVNIRTLLDVNPFEIEPNEGGTQLTAARGDHESSVFTGSCSCGAIEVTLNGSSSETEVKEDNCSICVRNAFLGVYPSKSQVTITDSGSKLKTYKFGRGFNGHPFCGVCGVHTHQILYGPPQSVIDRLPPERLAFVRKQLDIQPVNVRCLDGMNVTELAITRTDEGTEGYQVDD